MAALPEFFLSVQQADEETGLVPISYDAGQMDFHVSGIRVPLAEFDPFYGLAGLDIDDAGIEVSDIEKHPLYLTSLPDRLLATPMLHNWASPYTLQQGKAADVVREAFAQLQGGHGNIEADGAAMHTGCSVELRAGGGVHVQTIGSCACLGLAAEGVMVRGIDHGFGEYELHNVYSRAQRISLYAGIGHLAHLAAET